MCWALCSVLPGILKHRGGTGGLAFKEGASKRLEMGLGLSQDGAQAELKFSGKGWVWGVSPGRCGVGTGPTGEGVKGGVGLPGRSRPGTHRMEASPAPWRPPSRWGCLLPACVGRRARTELNLQVKGTL